MISAESDGPERARLLQLVVELREAAEVAWSARSVLAANLDACRRDLEHLIALSHLDVLDLRIATSRSRMVLAAFRATTGGHNRVQRVR
jgi:hypothetical protein